MDDPSRTDSTGSAADYASVRAETKTFRRPIAPLAYDCVKLMLIRDGSAILFSEFGEQFARAGDLVALHPSTLCGCTPEGPVTVTTLYLDTDYLLDQVFWQYAASLVDRLAGRAFGMQRYSLPAALVRLDRTVYEQLCLLFDALESTLSTRSASYFHVQALLSDVLDIVVPLIPTSPVRLPRMQRTHLAPSVPRHRTFAPLRTEALAAATLIRGDLGRQWTMRDLAEQVHLSARQLSRVFVDALGKTPLTYVTMLRSEEMARLLRETDMTVAAAGKAVGWRSRSQAREAFRRSLGITPERYRLSLCGRDSDTAGPDSDNPTGGGP